MKYQRAGIQASFLIHTAIFLSVFAMSRLVPTPSAPIPLELGILNGPADVVKNDSPAKIARVHPKNTVTPQPAFQQKTPSDTAVAEKPIVEQEQASSEPISNESSKSSNSETISRPSEVVGPVFDAEYFHNPRPVYPPAAKRMKLEGTVIVRVLVSPAGRPESVRLGKSSGATVLDQAAVNAVRNWSFIPARQGSTPVPAWVDIPVRFHLT